MFLTSVMWEETRAVHENARLTAENYVTASSLSEYLSTVYLVVQARQNAYTLTQTIHTIII